MQGRFNGCHGPKLFRLANAPDSELYVWKGRVPSTLTCAVRALLPSRRLSLPVPQLILSLQEFWRRCVAAGCAFRPGEAARGVFPLLFLRSRWRSRALDYAVAIDSTRYLQRPVSSMLATC